MAYASSLWQALFLLLLARQDRGPPAWWMAALLLGQQRLEKTIRPKPRGNQSCVSLAPTGAITGVVGLIGSAFAADMTAAEIKDQGICYR